MFSLIPIFIIKNIKYNILIPKINLKNPHNLGDILSAILSRKSTYFPTNQKGSSIYLFLFSIKFFRGETQFSLSFAPGKFEMIFLIVNGAMRCLMETMTTCGWL